MKKLIPILAMAVLTSCAPKYDKIIALSFDDGPSNVTADILDILKKEKVKATFFVGRRERSGHGAGIPRRSCH